MNARNRSFIGRGVLSTLPFSGPFYRSVVAQSAANSLTPKIKRLDSVQFYLHQQYYAFTSIAS